MALVVEDSGIVVLDVVAGIVEVVVVVVFALGVVVVEVVFV